MVQCDSKRRSDASRVSTTPAKLAHECAHAVMRAVPVVMYAIRAEMRRNGDRLLSMPQVRTLAYLHRSPGACLFRLAEHLGVTRSTASTLVERLVRRGMVSRAKDPHERRRVVLGLTPLGLRHFRRTRQATQRWMAAALSRLSAVELRHVKEGVTVLAARFDGTIERDDRGQACDAARGRCARVPGAAMGRDGDRGARVRGKGRNKPSGADGNGRRNGTA